MTEEKTFYLPDHPTRGKQKIMIEKPEGSVWHLLTEPGKTIPLPALRDKPKALDVLKALEDQCGERSVTDFMCNGYSKV